MNAFHTHLDNCERCRNHPFDLCRVGAAVLEAVVREKARAAPTAPATAPPPHRPAPGLPPEVETLLRTLAAAPEGARCCNAHFVTALAEAAAGLGWIVRALAPVDYFRGDVRAHGYIDLQLSRPGGPDVCDGCNVPLSQHGMHAGDGGGCPGKPIDLLPPVYIECDRRRPRPRSIAKLSRVRDPAIRAILLRDPLEGSPPYIIVTPAR